MQNTIGKVMAVCISEIRGTQKTNVSRADLKIGWGLDKDAHGGDWHRQVSLLSYDKIRGFNEKGAGVGHGDFGENLVVDGIDFRSLPVGTMLSCGSAVLEMTQIGKECHTHCQIYKKMGDCIMPREGVFARVIEGGSIAVGDSMQVIMQPKEKYRAAVVTLSDKGSEGKREDESGPIICQMLSEAGYDAFYSTILPDERTLIEDALIDISDRMQADLILTTGGTGFSLRDVTPEATMAVADREAPGIAEAIRHYSLGITGRAMLSRAVSALRGSTLIINLPGSPKAVKECLEYILPHLEHGLEMLATTGKDHDSGQDGL
ncbi:MAG: molybdopterin-binding protein [Eubacteriaceae bacterium]|nr:molybdopterin-binding protein [Eubacteriaceae bacterium]